MLYELLLRYADRVATTYPEISLGPVSRYLGLLAATTNRSDDAVRHFEDALAMSERIGARPWLAHTQDDYGHFLIRRGRLDDPDRAHELLDCARATYAELGMSPSRSSIADGPRPSAPFSMRG
jgi:hypothetical protein